MEKQYRLLAQAGSIATFLQLFIIILYTILTIKIGSRPETASEAFSAFEKGSLYGLAKDEILLVLMLSLYFINFSALFFIVKKKRFTMTFFASLFTFAAVILSISANSGFSLMHLSQLYNGSADEQTRSGLLAAGEAVLARNMWNSTSSYFSGFLLQGGGILMSLAMIGSGKFSKVTIISGIIGNGLDLIQHSFHYAAPGPAEMLIRAAGPFYIVWYIALAIDLWRCSREIDSSEEP